MPTSFYFMIDNEIHFLNGKNEYAIVDELPKNGHRSGQMIFCCFKGYTPDEEGLRKYKSDFNQWCEELSEQKIHKIFYKCYAGHNVATFKIFLQLCDVKVKDTFIDKISVLENKYWMNCNNGGLLYCNPGTYESYGYDFSAFYPSLLADKDFIFPVSSGYETTLNKLPKKKKLKLGCYRVKISCDNNRFNKVFSYSKAHTYTNYSLWFAMKYKKKYNVCIELIEDGQPNAYLYDDVITGDKVFGKWYNTLNSIKKIHPKNKLIKHLLSSLWGKLSETNVIYRNEKQIEEQGLKIGGSGLAEYEILDYVDNDKQAYYKLVDPNDYYKHCIRLKPFLTSYARMKVGLVAMKNIKHVIRIHTDGIVYAKEIKHGIDNLIPEDKTTGNIQWKNVNNYSLL